MFFRDVQGWLNSRKMLHREFVLFFSSVLAENETVTAMTDGRLWNEA